MLNPIDGPNVAENPDKANPATLMGHFEDYTNRPASQSAIQQEIADIQPFAMAGDAVMPIELIPATIDPDKLMAPPAVLIEGLLEEQGVLILGGNSKSGKSFLMAELAVAIAAGTTWLGFPCKKGKVLYVNMEIADHAFQYRLKDIALARGVCEETLDAGIKIMKRPGFMWTAQSLAASIINRFYGAGFDLVIIDPIYMLLDGDENSSTTMTQFVKQVDRIAQALGCAVGLVHHRAKGTSKYANVFDRACGSSVLGRYANTAIDINHLDGLGDAMRADIGTRSFAYPSSIDYVFDYPIYTLDETGRLATSRIASSHNQAGRREAEAATKIRKVAEAFDILVGDDGEVSQPVLVKHLGWGDRTVAKWIDRSGYFKIEKRGRTNWITKRE